MRIINYLKAVVIVHGKSEKQICEFIKQELRLKIDIYSDKNGEKSIQITGLKKILNNKIFKSKATFLQNYPDTKMDDIGRNISDEFKIFIIMDTDDCTPKQKEAYISKKMFEDHWAHKHIVPIFNYKNLEDVMKKAGIPFEKTGKHVKKEYIKVFPTDKKYKKGEIIQIAELSKKLKQIPETNLNEFFDFCLLVAD